MKKLVYISSDFFLDVDYPIVKELNRYFLLKWIVFVKIVPDSRYSCDEVLEYAKANSIDIEIKKITTRYRSLKQMMMDYRTVRDLKKVEADVYYFQAFFDPYLPIFSRLMLKRNKIVIGIHDAVPHKKFQSIILNINDRVYFSMFKNFHLYSEYQKSIFEKISPGKNILLAKLTLKDFGPAKHIMQRNKINFLFFGAIQYYKGVDYLIKAANLLAKEFDNFTVTIAGKCDDFGTYNELIEDPSVFTLNIKVIANQDIPDLFCNTDFLVLPYRDVTQSGPLLIAYNYNVPAIASNLPGFSEYIEDSTNGYLFEPNNYRSLYEAMKKALNLPSDKLIEIRTNLKKFVEDEISLNNITNTYIEYFEQL